MKNKNLNSATKKGCRFEQLVSLPLNYIALGAGVQSSTMALMAGKKLIEPMPEFAVFADTKDEPKKVYEWLGWLEKQLPFPVYRVAKDKSLWQQSTEVRTSKGGKKYLKTSLPVFTLAGTNVGKMKRQCTSEMKIQPILSFVRKRMTKGRKAIQWMGISYDEIYRMKDSREKWKTHRYPLIDLRMTRLDCLKWMEENGYPKPPRSACVYCPYHSDVEWNRLKYTEPREFKRAIQYEKELQRSMGETAIVGVPYLHKSLKPLSEVDFADYQLDLFNEECEGFCGI